MDARAVLELDLVAFEAADVWLDFDCAVRNPIEDSARDRWVRLAKLVIGLRQPEVGHLANVGVDHLADDQLSNLERDSRIGPAAELVGWLAEDVLRHDVRTAAG